MFASLSLYGDSWPSGGFISGDLEDPMFSCYERTPITRDRVEILQEIGMLSLVNLPSLYNAAHRQDVQANIDGGAHCKSRASSEWC